MIGVSYPAVTDRPAHTYNRAEPVTAGQIVTVDITLGPSATSFRAGDKIRLVTAGRWLWLHWGPARPAALTVPVITS